MEIKILALILLTFRLISVTFMGIILMKQLRLFKLTAPEDIITFRKVLFALALSIFIGQFVPIIIDTATLFAEVKRSNPNLLGVAYGVSNAFTALLASIAFWVMYKLAERGVKK